MQKINVYLWFDTQAEEAMHYYVSIFKNARVGDVMRAGPDGPVLSVNFQLEGQIFMVVNGGPQFKFNEAVSLFVNCESQAEVDELWDKLSAGGEPGACGWLKDRFGLSWQIIPAALGALLSDPDPGRAQRAMQAMLKMSKIDIAELTRAAAMSD